MYAADSNNIPSSMIPTTMTEPLNRIMLIRVLKLLKSILDQATSVIRDAEYFPNGIQPFTKTTAGKLWFMDKPTVNNSKNKQTILFIS